MARRGRPPYPDVLTPREWEVLALLREGLSNEQVAERLGITLAGAKYHVSEILGKLGVATREQAALWEPRARPWWATAVTPLGAAWQKIASGPAPALAATAAAVIIAAGIALLAWALLRTNGGSGTSALAPTGTVMIATQPAIAGAPTSTPVPAGTTGTACPGGPTAPRTSTPLVAYAAPDNTIWVVGADGANATQLICSATGAGSANWSPSGKFVAYSNADGSLHILDTETGRDATVDDRTSDLIIGGWSTLWSPVNDVLAYAKSGGIWEVDAQTNLSPTRITPLDTGQFAWSPDGRRITYEVPPSKPSTPPNVEPGQIYVVNSDGTDNHKVTDGSFILYSSNPWSPDGRLIAFWRNVSGGSALGGDAFVFDTQTQQEFPVGRVSSDEHSGWSSNRNRSVYYTFAIDVESHSATPLFDPSGSLLDWSRDGTRVAYVQVTRAPSPADPSGEHALAIFDTETGQSTVYERSSGQIWVHLPGYVGGWSPDGRYFAFVANEGGSAGGLGGVLYVANLSTGTATRVVDHLDYTSTIPYYSPDGSHLLIQRYSPDSISIANSDGSDMRRVADGRVIPAVGFWAADWGWRPSP